MEYKWKDNLGLLKPKVSAEVAVSVFSTIENTMGKLTAKNLLEYSKNPKTPLHNMFEWDDTIAARQYRLNQARKIIKSVEIVTISDGEPLEVLAYEVVRSDGGNAYKEVSVLTMDEAEYVKQQTKESINHLKNKLMRFQRFQEIVQDLSGVQQKLESS